MYIPYQSARWRQQQKPISRHLNYALRAIFCSKWVSGVKGYDNIHITCLCVVLITKQGSLSQPFKCECNKTWHMMAHWSIFLTLPEFQHLSLYISVSFLRILPTLISNTNDSYYIKSLHAMFTVIASFHNTIHRNIKSYNLNPSVLQTTPDI